MRKDHGPDPVIPYTDEHTHLRNYRPSPVDSRPPSRAWLWLILVVGLILLINVTLAHWLHGSVGA